MWFEQEHRLRVEQIRLKGKEDELQMKREHVDAHEAAIKRHEGPQAR